MLIVDAPGLDDRLIRPRAGTILGAGRILGRELDLRVLAQRLARPGDPLAGVRERLLARQLELVLEVDVRLVAMNRWRCGHSATPIASTARWGSPSRHRASAPRPRSRPWSPGRSGGPRRSRPARRPGSRPGSRRHGAGRAERATSSFSAAVRPAPGACSPSRRVVSKIRTEPAGTPSPKRGWVASNARPPPRVPRPGPSSRRASWPASTTTGLRNGQAQAVADAAGRGTRGGGRAMSVRGDPARFGGGVGRGVGPDLRHHAARRRAGTRAPV